MTTDYFDRKAREVLTRAGGTGNPDAFGPLATWARHAALVARDPLRGVIVGQDGTVLAQTRHVPATIATPGTTYVRTCYADPSLAGLEVGLVCASLRRLTGQGVIHVRYSEVCTGPVWHEDLTTH
jgi:hypothetical protein